MNTIEAFDVHVDTSMNPLAVTVDGTAHYDSGAHGPLRFAFTFERAADLGALSYMVDAPFDREPFVPVTGWVSTDDTTVAIAAVRADALLFWAGEDPRPQVRMVMEFLPPGLHHYDAHVDYASEFLRLEPADWSRVRRELRRGVALLPDRTR